MIGDVELIKRLNESDKDSFEMLYDRYVGMVYGFLNSLLKNEFGSLTPFSKTKQFYLLIDFLLKVFFLSNLIRIFVALYGTIAL